MWKHILFLSILGAIVVCSQAQEYFLEEQAPLTERRTWQEKYRDLLDEEGKERSDLTEDKMQKIRELKAEELDDMNLESEEGDDLTYFDLSVPENEGKIVSQRVVIAKR